MSNRLGEIQKWVYREITQVNQSKPSEVDELITPSNNLTSAERMGIYQTSYLARLVECMNHEYKALRHAMGEELFHHFAINYLSTYPSKTYTLHELGKNFPTYLEESLLQELKGNEADPWQLFILDMAKYERTYIEVFHSNGHEDLESLEALPNTPIRLSPAVQTLSIQFPIADIILEARKGQINDLPQKEIIHYVFVRDNYRVKSHRISETELEALQKWMNNSKLDCPVQFQNQWLLKRICYYSS